MNFDEESLRKCCGSTSWVLQMLERQPFADENALLKASDEVCKSLNRIDWLEAFAQHPKIGDRRGGKWASEEQQGMDKATAETAAEMRELNELYERKFGWVFIVCATGKTAGEMHKLLVQRLENEPREEILIAAREQAEIAKLRLKKLLAE